MFHLQVISLERKLDIPTYLLSRKKDNSKSCFIDHNRIDIVKKIKNIENNSIISQIYENVEQ